MQPLTIHKRGPISQSIHWGGSSARKPKPLGLGYFVTPSSVPQGTKISSTEHTSRTSKMRLLIGDDVGQAKGVCTVFHAPTQIADTLTMTVVETRRGIDTTLPSSDRATTASFFPPSRTRAIQHAILVSFQSRDNLVLTVATSPNDSQN
jgi:hypothetical protein